MYASPLICASLFEVGRLGLQLAEDALDLSDRRLRCGLVRAGRLHVIPGGIVGFGRDRTGEDEHEDTRADDDAGESAPRARECLDTTAS